MQSVDSVNQPMDFTCVETQIGNGDPADCEIVDLGARLGTFKVKINV